MRSPRTTGRSSRGRRRSSPLWNFLPPRQYSFQTAPEPLTHDNCYDGGRRLRSFERNAFPEHRVDSAIMHEMSKVAVPRSKSARKTPRKSARIALSSRRRRTKSEDRLDGMAATNALKESAERIPYRKARRDLDL